MRNYLIPAVLLVGAVAAAPFEPLATLILVALSLATFFGALSAKTAAREPRRLVFILIWTCVLIVPLRTALDAIRGREVDLHHEALMFAASLVLVAAFLAGRWLAGRDGS